MKSTLTILRANKGYYRTAYGAQTIVELQCNAEGELWCKVCDELTHRPCKGREKLILPSGQVDLAVETEGEIVCATTSSPLRWKRLIDEAKGKEKAPKKENETPDQKPQKPTSDDGSATPSQLPETVEIVEVLPQAKPAPSSWEERMAGYPPAVSLNEALPEAYFVQVAEEGEPPYVLGAWYRDGEIVRYGYGVQGDPDRPLDGGEYVAGYWVVWKE